MVRDAFRRRSGLEAAHILSLAQGLLADRWGFDNQVYGWTLDGAAVLFRFVSGGSFSRTHSCTTVPFGGGAATALPMPVSGAGHFSPDGRRIVYSPLWRDFRSEKRYQGGWANDLFIFDLEHPALVQVTKDPRTDRDPMWIGGAIHDIRIVPAYSIYIATTSSRAKPRQLTHFHHRRSRWPSAEAPTGLIVYELDGELHIYDTRNEQDRALTITVPADAFIAGAQAVNAADNIESHAISPGGERVAIVARGDVFSIPVEHGIARNLTQSSTAHDREAAWSGDGKRLAYISDRSGEEELYVQARDGATPAQAVTSGSAGRYLALLVGRRQAHRIGRSNRTPLRDRIGEQAPDRRGQGSRRVGTRLSVVSGRSILELLAE